MYESHGRLWGVTHPRERIQTVRQDGTGHSRICLIAWVLAAGDRSGDLRPKC